MSGTEGMQLVISAPTDHHALQLATRAKCRTTLGALTQMIAASRHTITMAAPFLHGENAVTSGPLANALIGALNRGVHLQILSTGGSLEAVDIWNFHSTRQSQMRIYRPSINLHDDRFIGSHAKLCIVDWRTAYIGSANFTRAGFRQQVEIGVMVGGPIVNQLKDFWQYCIDEQLFTQIFRPA